MYTGYYMERSDGDGELIGVLCDEDLSPLEDDYLQYLQISFRVILNQLFGELGIGWFVRSQGTCDFPDIWDNKENIIKTDHDLTFTIDISVSDHEGNEFHWYHYFHTASLELAKEEARIKAIELNKAYTIIDIRVDHELIHKGDIDA